MARSRSSRLRARCWRSRGLKQTGDLAWQCLGDLQQFAEGPCARIQLADSGGDSSGPSSGHGHRRCCSPHLLFPLLSVAVVEAANGHCYAGHDACGKRGWVEPVDAPEAEPTAGQGPAAGLPCEAGGGPVRRQAEQGRHMPYHRRPGMETLSPVRFPSRQVFLRRTAGGLERLGTSLDMAAPGTWQHHMRLYIRHTGRFGRCCAS